MGMLLVKRCMHVMRAGSRTRAPGGTLCVVLYGRGRLSWKVSNVKRTPEISEADTGFLAVDVLPYACTSWSRVQAVNRYCLLLPFLRMCMASADLRHGQATAVS